MKKGISLVVLVITIIVLIILASVGVMTITGQNGILKKVNVAAKNADEAMAQEEIVFAISNCKIDYWSQWQSGSSNQDRMELTTEGLNNQLEGIGNVSSVEYYDDAGVYVINYSRHSNPNVSYTFTMNSNNKIYDLTNTTWVFNDELTDFSWFGEGSFEEQTWPFSIYGTIPSDEYGTRTFMGISADTTEAVSNAYTLTFWGNNGLAYGYVQNAIVNGETINAWTYLTDEESFQWCYGEISIEDVISLMVSRIGSKPSSITFTGGPDATNSEFIAWLLQNATLVR